MSTEDLQALGEAFLANPSGPARDQFFAWRAEVSSQLKRLQAGLERQFHALAAEPITSRVLWPDELRAHMLDGTGLRDIDDLATIRMVFQTSASRDRVTQALESSLAQREQEHQVTRDGDRPEDWRLGIHLTARLGDVPFTMELVTEAEQSLNQIREQTTGHAIPTPGTPVARLEAALDAIGAELAQNPASPCNQARAHIEGAIKELNGENPTKLRRLVERHVILRQRDARLGQEHPRVELAPEAMGDGPPVGTVKKPTDEKTPSLGLPGTRGANQRENDVALLQELRELQQVADRPRVTRAEAFFLLPEVKDALADGKVDIPTIQRDVRLLRLADNLAQELNTERERALDRLAIRHTDFDAARERLARSGHVQTVTATLPPSEAATVTMMGNEAVTLTMDGPNAADPAALLVEHLARPELDRKDAHRVWEILNQAPTKPLAERFEYLLASKAAAEPTKRAFRALHAHFLEPGQRGCEMVAATDQTAGTKCARRVRELLGEMNCRAEQRVEQKHQPPIEHQQKHEKKQRHQQGLSFGF